MRNMVPTNCALMIVAVICSTPMFCLPVMAQSNKDSRLPPTLKRSGSDSKKPASTSTDKKVDKGNVANEEDVIRVETSLVTCNVLVLDKQGKAVTGLSQKDFIITEDDKRQEIGSFTLGDDTAVPRSIVLIMDYSASMLPYIQMSVEAAKVLVDKLGPKDTMAIIADDLTLLTDFTRDKDDLKKQLDSLKEKAKQDPTKLSFYSGHSLQFSALLATLREMFDEEDVRPVIIFQTDGDELEMIEPPPGSLRAGKSWGFRMKDVYTEAEKSRATIYSVIPGIRFAGLSPDEQLKQFGSFEKNVMRQSCAAKELAKQGQQLTLGPGVARREIESRTREQFAVAGVAELTGGLTVFLEDPTQAAGIYSSILSDINRRYVISYYPTNKDHDGKRRNVRIEVLEHQEYTIWGRKSYYAPGPGDSQRVR